MVSSRGEVLEFVLCEIQGIVAHGSVTKTCSNHHLSTRCKALSDPLKEEQADLSRDMLKYVYHEDNGRTRQRYGVSRKVNSP